MVTIRLSNKKFSRISNRNRQQQNWRLLILVVALTVFLLLTFSDENARYVYRTKNLSASLLNIYASTDGSTARLLNHTLMAKLISPGDHTNIPGPDQRIGPDGELGFIRHDPQFLLKNPVPFRIPDKERKMLCKPPGEGKEKPEGARNLKKIRTHIKKSTEPRNVTLFCAVHTYGGGVNHTNAISETWGKKCDGLLFASDNFSNGHIRLHTNSNHGFGYKGMIQRTRTILAYLYDNFLNDYDYFHIGGDDIYLIVENLKEFLASEDVQNWDKVRDQYLMAGFWLHWVKHAEGYFYLGGGSGYTLSRKALKSFVEGPLQTCNTGQEGLPGDVWFSDCARMLSQNFIDTRDDVGAHRYHQLPVQQHATFPKKKWGFSMQIINASLKHLERNFSFPPVYMDDYISASSVVFHKHAPIMLRRYELLLYGDKNLTNCHL